MKYTPIKKIGRRGRVMMGIRKDVWPRVLARARYRCEGCGGQKPLEWAHLFGRPTTGLRLGPWANLPALTAALCRNCHNGVDRHTDKQLTERLQFEALRRLEDGTMSLSGDGTIRTLIMGLEATGWYVDQERMVVVKAV